MLAHLFTLPRALAETTSPMDMSSAMDYLLLALFFGSGLYFIWSALALRKNDVIADNKVLIPSGKEAKKCKQAEPFRRFMFPKAMVMGAVLLLSGAALMADALLPGTRVWLNVLLTVLPLLMLVWYTRQLHKAEKLFW